MTHANLHGSGWAAAIATGMLFGIGVLPMTANAAQPKLEVTPFASYRAGGQFIGANGNVLDVEASNGLALAINWRTAEYGKQYELLFSRQDSKTDAGSPVNMQVEYLHLGGTVDLGAEGERVLPFAVGGIGATRFSPPAGLSAATRWSMNLGGGVRVPLTEYVRLRVEARGYLTWMGGQANLFCAGGCVLTAKARTFFQYEALAGVSIGF